MRRIALAFALTLTAQAQWQILDSHSTASFRGVDALKNGVVWVSGTEGTVLRSIDDGKTWTRCAAPPGAEKLDFRGVQGFDEKTAIVMSSGKGDLSRLYRTVDGCRDWKLMLTGPDKDGFFDSFFALGPSAAMILSDSVVVRPADESLGAVIRVLDWGERDTRTDPFFEQPADTGESSFAASNSVFVHGQTHSYFWIASGTAEHSYIRRTLNEPSIDCDSCMARTSEKIETPMAQGRNSAGVFSLAFVNDTLGVAVGGDYKTPEARSKTAIYTMDRGASWKLAITSPGGYRSSVKYYDPSHTWIAVGPNGSDISTDDGKNWKPLAPSKDDAQDADKNWNALSLPFVVGPKGRIGKLRSDALTKTK